MKILRYFANGYLSIVDAYLHPREYIRPSKYGFYRDQENLIGDVREFGNDMRRVIERKHVEQAYKSTGH